MPLGVRQQVMTRLRLVPAAVVALWFAGRTVDTAVPRARGHGRRSRQRRTEAVRLLRRRLSDVVFTALRTDDNEMPSPPDQLDPTGDRGLMR